MKLGKSPATVDHRDLLFCDYRLSPPLPPHPRTFGHEKLIPDWQMLGNDEVGDCTCAGSAHEVMLINAEAGRKVEFTTEDVLADYSAITGYDPADPSTDRGANIRDVLKFRRTFGMKDSLGRRHKIDGFAALEPGNTDELLEAAWIFGAVAIGFEMPASAMDQTRAGKPWSVVRGSPIEGGHYTPGIACRGAGYLAPFADTLLGDLMGTSAKNLIVVTWGQLQGVTFPFYGKYNDEAFAIYSKEIVGASGKSLEGFDVAAFEADLHRIAA